MIKFTAGKLVGLCLTEMNIQKLKEGKSIFIEGKDMGVNKDIFLVYGHSEETIMKQLDQAGFITDETTITKVREH